MENVRFINLQVLANNLQDLQRQSPIRLIRNITQTYELWLKKQRFAITDQAKEIFFKEFIAKKYKNAPDIGFYIKVRGDINTSAENAFVIHKKPYEYINLDISSSRINYRDKRHKKCYILIDDTTNTILGYSIGNKQKAIMMAKSLYKEEGYKGDITCYKVTVCTNEENTSFKMHYQMSSRYVKQYIIFGYQTIK